MQETPPLITAAQHGDPDAIAQLYRTHHTTIHHYLTRRVGADLGADLAQDVWVRAIRALPAYRWTGRPFEAWLTTIARNLIADHAKRASHRAELLVPDLPDTASTPSAEQHVLAALDGQPVRTALATLHPQWREALVLDHWAGLTDRQIADRTGRSPAGVRTLKHRGRSALRARLAA